MERPVQSFESFKRTAAPHPAPPGDKPLPAIPASKRRSARTSSPPTSIALDRKTTWKAPSEWDDEIPATQVPTAPSSPRDYQLLIPEPSPGPGDGQGPASFPFTSISKQSFPLEPIDEQDSRKAPQSSSHFSASSSLHVQGPEDDCSLPAVSADIDAIVALYDSPMPLSEQPLSNRIEKQQQLNVFEDYHNLLAEQYHEVHINQDQAKMDHLEEKGAPVVTSAKATDLIPRPLSWMKDSAPSPPSSSRSTRDAGSRPDSPAIVSRHRKMSSWVHPHQPPHARDGSRRDEEQPRHAEKLKPEKNRLLHRDIHLSHLIPQVKRFRANTASRDAPEPKPATMLPSKSLPAESADALMRLPGGLAIVRHSPSPKPSSQKSRLAAISLPLSASQSVDKTSQVSTRRSSLYSQPCDSRVAPTIVVHTRTRSSLSSPPSPRIQSSTSSPPTSPPLGYEIAFPRTPPPRPPTTRVPRPPPTLSLWSQPDGRPSADDGTDGAKEAKEAAPQKHGFRLGILDRAKGARHHWKQHQRDAKHARLKQSIRLVGPTDAAASAAYATPSGRTLDAKGAHKNNRREHDMSR
ncbi:hypothetical protein ACEQ8H_006793 [Pleosporales sp. CAS-2024a]